MNRGLWDDKEVQKAESPKPKYPWFIIFILGSAFCERFTYYGMKTVLALFFTTKLLFSDDDATFFHHLLSILCCFLPVLGAWIAESLIGKFRTILYLSLVYILGLLVLTLSAMPPVPFEPIAGTMGALLLIAIGAGGIKPCVSAYGADQFKAGQERHRERFFAYFYFCINAGSFVSAFVTPVLRNNTCFALAFGVPAALMVVALILFVLGKPFYTDTPIYGSLLCRVICCIGHAIVSNIKGRKGAKGQRRKPSIAPEMSTASDAVLIPTHYPSESPKDKCVSFWKGKRRASTTHWLDAAADKYNAEFIGDVKQLIHVLFMFLPIPVFWALFELQGSRWALQASQMDGRVTDTYYFQPDQMEFFNPVLILIFIPCFEKILYPVIHKLKIPFRLLARMVLGMVLAGVALLIAGFLQIAVDKTLPRVLAADRSEMRIFNSIPCDLVLSGRMFQNGSQNIGPHSMVHIPSFSIDGANETLLKVSPANCPTLFAANTEVLVSTSGGTGYFVFLGVQNGQLTHKQIVAKDMEPEHGFSKALFIVPFALNTTSCTGNITLINPKIADEKAGHLINVLFNSRSALLGNGNQTITTAAADVGQGPYVMYLSNQESHFGADLMGTKELHFPVGGYYVVLLKDFSSSVAGNDSWETYTVVEPNSISIFWQFPQYFVITMAQVFLSVSGLSFAYSEAPESMRSGMQAAWLLTSAFGSAIVMIIGEEHLIASQAVEFFGFAGLFGIFAVIFAIMSHFYRYVKPNEKTIEMYQMTDKGDGDAVHKKDDSYGDSLSKREKDS